MNEGRSNESVAVSALRKADARYGHLLFECVGQHGLDGGIAVYSKLLDGADADLERALEDAVGKWEKGPSDRQRKGVVAVISKWRYMLETIRDRSFKTDITGLLISLDFLKATAKTETDDQKKKAEADADKAADLLKVGNEFLNRNAVSIIAGAMIIIVSFMLFGTIIDPKVLAIVALIAAYVAWHKLKPIFQRGEAKKKKESSSKPSVSRWPVVAVVCLLAVVLFVSTSTTDDISGSEGGVRVGVEGGGESTELEVNTEVPATPTPTSTPLPTAEAIYLKTAVDNVSAVYGRCLTDNFVQLQGYARGTEGGVADDFANITFDKLSKSDDIVAGLIAQGYSAIQGTSHEEQYTKLAELLNGGNGVRGVCEMVSVDLASAFTGGTREELQANLQKIPGIMEQIKPLAEEIQVKAAEYFDLSLPDLPEVDGAALAGVYNDLVVAANTPTPRPPAPTSAPRQIIVTVVAPAQPTATPHQQVVFPTSTPTRAPDLSGATAPPFCMTGLYYYSSSGGIGPKAVGAGVVGCDPATGASITVQVETAVTVVKGTASLGSYPKFWVVLADGRDIVVLERDLRW